MGGNHRGGSLDGNGLVDNRAGGSDLVAGAVSVCHKVVDVDHCDHELRGQHPLGPAAERDVRIGPQHEEPVGERHARTMKIPT